MPKWWSDSTRRFARRPFYGESEIEQAALSELRRIAGEAGTEPSWPLSDELLEAMVDALTLKSDLYADLSRAQARLQFDVDGYTVFSRTNNPTIFVNQDLDNPKYRRRRRMTTAHELGHVILHQPLYRRDERQMEFLLPQELIPVYCAGKEIANSVDWCEWQASFFAGALLMPTRELQAKLTSSEPRLLESMIVGTAEALRVTSITSNIFEVSKEAARVRLAQLGIIKPPAVQMLDIELAT